MGFDESNREGILPPWKPLPAETALAWKHRAHFCYNMSPTTRKNLTGHNGSSTIETDLFLQRLRQVFLVSRRSGPPVIQGPAVLLPLGPHHNRHPQEGKEKEAGRHLGGVRGPGLGVAHVPVLVFHWLEAIPTLTPNCGGRWKCSPAACPRRRGKDFGD